MGNTIKVEAVPEQDDAGAPVAPTFVKVSVVSEGERDLSVKVQGVDLIQQVASALRLSATISEMHGDADNANEGG